MSTGREWAQRVIGPEGRREWQLYKTLADLAEAGLGGARPVCGMIEPVDFEPYRGELVAFCYRMYDLALHLAS
jgi:hypothetical protein